MNIEKQASENVDADNLQTKTKSSTNVNTCANSIKNSIQPNFDNCLGLSIIGSLAPEDTMSNVSQELSSS